MRSCLRELDGTIVIYLGHRVWARLLVFSMLAVRIKDNHHLISYGIVVGFALGIFSFVVLKDAMLLAILNVFPVRLESYI